MVRIERIVIAGGAAPYELRLTARVEGGDADEMMRRLDRDRASGGAAYCEMERAISAALDGVASSAAAAGEIGDIAI